MPVVSPITLPICVNSHVAPSETQLPRAPRTLLAPASATLPAASPAAPATPEAS
jgi:hypothetical protein